MEKIEEIPAEQNQQQLAKVDESTDTDNNSHTLEAPAAGVITPLMTIGSDQPQAGTNMVEHSISIAMPSAQKHKDETVQVKIEYPKSFKGPKFFKDGDIKNVAKETAEQFVKSGIASLVKESDK